MQTTSSWPWPAPKRYSPQAAALASFSMTTGSPTRFSSFRDLVNGVWIPLSIALNQINKSMGRDALYPFVIPVKALDKLEFVASLAGLPLSERE